MIDWAELATLTAEVNRMQGQRQAAAARHEFALVKAISYELDRAVSERDVLMSQIAERIGGGSATAQDANTAS